MATVVNITPNDPWAGFGTAFSKSLAQKRQIEGQKALMKYQQELEQKKYAAEGTILESLGKAQEAVNKPAQKTAEVAKQGLFDKLVDMMSSNGEESVPTIPEEPKQVSLGGAAPDKLLHPLQENMQKPVPAAFSPSPNDNLMEKATQEVPDVANVIQGMSDSQKTWYSQQKIKGLTLRRDPVTQQLTLVKRREATGMDAVSLANTKTNLEIQNTRLKLEMSELDAKEKREYFTTFKPQRIKDIKSMIMSDQRLHQFLPKVDGSIDTSVEAVTNLAEEMFEKKGGFSTFMLSLNGKGVYIRKGANVSNLMDADISATPKKGYLKDTMFMQTANIQLGYAKIEAAGAPGQKPRSYLTHEEKRVADLGTLGIDSKHEGLPRGSVNAIRMDDWRQSRGKQESATRSKLDSAIYSFFPVSGEGRNYEAAKTLATRFHADTRRSVNQYLDSTASYFNNNETVPAEFVDSPDRIISVMEGIYKREHAKIANTESGSNAYKKTLEIYKGKESKGQFFKEAMTRIDKAESFGIRKPRPVVDPAVLANKTLLRCLKSGIDCSNMADPRVQALYKNAETHQFKNDPDGYLLFKTSISELLSQGTQSNNVDVSIPSSYFGIGS